MQFIVIPHQQAKARTIRVSARHVVASIGLGLVLLAGLTVGLYWLSIRVAAELRLPYLQQFVLAADNSEAQRAAEIVQQGLTRMAVKLGEAQAELTRLNAVGERLTALAGFTGPDLIHAAAPGLGGASPSRIPPQSLTLQEFRQMLAEVSRRLENRSDAFGVIEARLLEKAVRHELVPNMMPVAVPLRASGFGRRIDPFTGQWAMHEGIDFPAGLGTPIRAAAGGVVAFAGFHYQYGFMLDIDHGNDLVTRYAHASRLLVREGDIVKRGGKIAESGSTGYSTGPHVHFEVRHKGEAQNPARFLRASTTTSPVEVGEAAGLVALSR